MERTYEEVKERVALTCKQISYMRHAIGLEGTYIRKKKHYVYRNCFYDKKNKDWEYLKFWGLARSVGDYYKLTSHGIKILEEIYNMEIVFI